MKEELKEINDRELYKLYRNIEEYLEYLNMELNKVDEEQGG